MYNGGLVLWILLNFFPIGWPQLLASYEHGLAKPDPTFFAIPARLLGCPAERLVMIGDSIEVSVLSVLGEKVRLGIQAPRDVPVFRKEVFLEIQAQNVEAAGSSREALDGALGMIGEAEAK